MTALFATGFEPHDPTGTRSALDDEWDFVEDLDDADVTIAAGRFGGQCVDIHCNTGHVATTRSPAMQLPLGGLSSSSTWIIGFAFRPLSTPTVVFPLLWWEDSEDGAMLCLCTTSTGGLSLRRGTNLSTEIASYAGPIGNDWMYLEMKVLFHQSAGTCEVRVGASTELPTTPTTVINFSGDTTGTSGVRPYQVGLASDGTGSQRPHFQYDDIYILDGTDATATQGQAFNDFLGDISVFRVRPNGVGDSSDFTPSAAVDNYTLVDEDAQDGDTTYVESKTADELDLYEYEDLDADEIDEILFVIDRPILRKTDAGTRTYNLAAKSGATTELSDVRQLSETYVRQDYLWPLDPDTGVAWTVSGFNAAQFGQQVSA